MTKTFLLATGALGLMAAAPAQAQLLGGGGGLGGSLGGTLSGVSGPLTNLPDNALRSSTRGSARGDARTSGNQRVDRRQGSVAIDRSIAGNFDAAGAQLIDTPAGSSSAAGSASGSTTKSGSANAQLIGTDALRDVAGNAVDRGRSVAGTVRDRATGVTERARGLTSSASGSGAAQGAGSGSLGEGMLAAAGSGAAAGDGAFAVAPGMPVLAPNGARFGKVRQVITDSRGRVTNVLVRAKDRDVTLPAASLSGSGSALLMGDGTVRTTPPTDSGSDADQRTAGQ